MNPSEPSSPFRNDLLMGKRALVTGAGKGIGRQCVVSLCAAGAQVMAVARTESDLNSLVKECGSLVNMNVADVSSSDFLQKIGDMPAFDILVNNVGMNKVQSFVDVDDETLDTMLEVNVRSLIRVTRATVKRMLLENTNGSIINMSSQMGHIGSPGRTMYCTTKHAVEGFTKALAVELAEEGIRVNAVAPTFIDTPLTKPMLQDPGFYDFVMGMIPMKKIGTTTDVANAVVYLASEASALVTGTSMRVDGGWTAR